MGGQHISAACLWMRKKMKKDQPNLRDANMPAAYVHARAVVLKVDTPRRALVSAAGYHQSTQQDSVSCLMTDVMKMMGRYSAEKQNITGRSSLSDDELLGCLTAMGLERGNREILKKSEGQTMSAEKAMEFEEKTVCL